MPRCSGAGARWSPSRLVDAVAPRAGWRSGARQLRARGHTILTELRGLATVARIGSVTTPSGGVHEPAEYLDRPGPTRLHGRRVGTTYLHVLTARIGDWSGSRAARCGRCSTRCRARTGGVPRRVRDRVARAYPGAPTARSSRSGGSSWWPRRARARASRLGLAFAGRLPSSSTSPRLAGPLGRRPRARRSASSSAARSSVHATRPVAPAQAGVGLAVR